MFEKHKNPWDSQIFTKSWFISIRIPSQKLVTWNGEKKRTWVSAADTTKSLWFCNFHHLPPKSGHNLNQEELFFGGRVIFENFTNVFGKYACFQIVILFGELFFGERALWKTIGDPNGADWEPLSDFVKNGPSKWIIKTGSKQAFLNLKRCQRISLKVKDAGSSYLKPS